jgi:nucleoid-associated protein YgaU
MMALTAARRRPAALLPVAAAAAGLLATYRPDIAGSSDPDRAIVLAASWGAWLVAAYLLVALAVMLATHLANGTAARVAPRHLQARIERVLGVAVAATVLAQPTVAYADTPHPRPGGPVGTGSRVTPQLSVDWPALQPARRPLDAVPPTIRLAHPPRARRPVLAPPPASSATPPDRLDARPAVPSAGRPAAHRTATVTVRRGDSLWTMAAARRGADATALRVAAEWPRWWAANRGLIGPDPDLIHPGQRLQPPDPRSSR